MKSILSRLCLLMICIAVPGVLWAGDKEDIAATAQKWANAFNAYDLDAITALYTEDGALWGTTSPTLRTTPEQRQEYFAGAFNWATEQKNGLKGEFGDSVIRIYGDTAVNTGNYSFSWTKEGKTNSIPARFSFTYVKQDGEWKIVDHHSSKVPE